MQEKTIDTGVKHCNRTPQLDQKTLVAFDFGRYFLFYCTATCGTSGWCSRNPLVPRKPSWKPLV